MEAADAGHGEGLGVDLVEPPAQQTFREVWDLGEWKSR